MRNESASQAAAREASLPSVRQIGRWTVHEEKVVPSTNLLAADLPAWHAVSADCQTAGRGRFQRTWISDRGGLWLSAVLPVSRPASLKMLPLAAGLALSDALRSYGLEQIRMRWPNDLLVGDRKLAGLLLDQFVSGRAVVGLGVNISNRPEESDPALCGLVARVEDLTTLVPSPTELMGRVLTALEEVVMTLDRLDAESLLPRINALWPGPRLVHLDLDGQFVTGRFEGVDATGRLRLRMAPHETVFYEPHQVRLLREIPNS